MAIIDEGRELEARRILLLQGEDRFGLPDETVKKRLQAITALEHLERFGRHLFRVSSWQELLDTP
jgi:hypothetical protein